MSQKIFLKIYAAIGSIEVSQGNPVRIGNCPATVKGTKAKKTVKSEE